MEVFVYILFKMGRLIAYQYAVIGKQISCEELVPCDMVKPARMGRNSSTFKPDPHKLSEFMKAECKSVHSIHTSSSDEEEQSNPDDLHGFLTRKDTPSEQPFAHLLGMA